MLLRRLLPGHTGILWNLLPLTRAFASSAWRSATGAPPPTEPPSGEPFPDRGRPDRGADFHRYLELTDAADLAGGGPAVPPLHFMTWSFAPYLRLISSGELPISLFGVLHVQNDLQVHEPLLAHEDASVKVYVERIQPQAERSLVTIHSDLEAGGTQRAQMRTLLLAGPRPEAEQPAALPTVDPGEARWRTVREVRLDRALGRRYGVLTGDLNPIHLHPWTSRPFGLESPVAHGFCVKAVVAHALVRELGQGRFAALRRLRVRFRAPVSLPCTALCQVDGRMVRLVDAERQTLLLNGRYRLHSANGT